MVRRVTVELPERSFERLLWCREQTEVPSMVAVIRRALYLYEMHLKAQKEAGVDISEAV